MKAKFAQEPEKENEERALRQPPREEAEKLVASANRSLEELHRATRTFTSESMLWRAGLFKVRNICFELRYIEELLTQAFSDDLCETDQRRSTLVSLLDYHERASVL